MARALAGPGPSGSGVLPGRISWFGGPNDSTTGSTTASGAPTSTPGIAVYNRKTLGGWWLVKLPNGVITLVRRTDIGPAPSTGRTFDFTYSLLHFLGYSQNDFPTNGAAQGVYIGKASSVNALSAANGAQISSALAALGATGQQSQTFVAQLDAGATQGNPNVIAVDPTGTKPTSDQSTALRGDAQSAGINLPNPLSGVEAIGALLTSSEFWIRLGEAILGVLLVAMGLRSLTGATSSPVSIITSGAAKAAAL